MAALTVVQAWATATTGTSTVLTSLTCTWGATPTNGNLLLAFAGTDSVMATPSGWTVLDSTVASQGAYLWGRIASSEPGSFAAASSGGGAFRGAVAFAEYSGQLAGAIASVLDAHTTASRVGGSISAMSTGTTGTTAQADELAVACWNAHTSGGSTNWSGQTNGFTEVADDTSTAAAGIRDGVCVAVLDLHATQTVECTATPSLSTEAGVIIATFKAAAGSVVNPLPPMIAPSAAVQRAANW